jgi:hypothetical protein
MAKMTHYQLAKLVNFRLSQEGLAEVRSQQIYNALRNKPEFDTDDPQTLKWIEQYVDARRTGRTQRNSIDPAAWFAQHASDQEVEQDA